MASCWNLVSCSPGSYPDISNYTETNISIYEGQYVYINSDDTQVYQVVPVEDTDCIPTENDPITSLVIVPNCNDQCDCPEGFVYNIEQDLCILNSTTDVIINPNNYEVEAAQDVSSYGNAGGIFYPLLDNLSLPIRRFTTLPELFEDDSTPYNPDPTIIPNPIFPVWKDRLNIAGIWNPLIPVGEWIGFSACVDVPVTAVYTIGIASDNRCRFRINGQEIFTTAATNLNTWNFRYWHLFPITLNAGQNIIEMEGYNESAFAAFAAEIYNANSQTLSLIDSVDELSEVTIFSTINKIGDLFDLGETVGYSCPEGYSLSNCDGEISCVLRLEAPYTPCCIQLEDCSGTLDDIFVSDTFEVLVNSVIKLEEYPDTCWLVIQKKIPCEGESDIVTVTETFDTCTSCNQSDFEIEACEIIPEVVEPNFETRFCDEEKTIERYCDFAESIYSIFKSLKYGITGCCEFDHYKAEIKYEIIRLQEMYDPDLCIEIVPAVPNPCAPEPEPISCPENVSSACTPPTGVSASITYLT